MGPLSALDTLLQTSTLVRGSSPMRSPGSPGSSHRSYVRQSKGRRRGSCVILLLAGFSFDANLRSA
jgi:hypothetical protein